MRRSTFRMLICLLLLFAKNAEAQYTSVDLTYGNTIFTRDFLGQLNTTASYKHGRPMQYAGLMISGMQTNGRINISGNFIMAQYLPQQFYVNDSLQGNISGCFFGLTAGADLFPKVKSFDLIFSGGLNLGRMKLVQKEFNYFQHRDNILHRKNMLISPKFGVMAKVFIWHRFSITLNAEYAYDISGPRWQEKILAVGKPHSVSVPNFNQSGFYCSVGIGFNVPFFSSSGMHTPASPFGRKHAENEEIAPEEE